MRTTLDIDDDILQAAKELARAEKKTAGEVLSELARRALTGHVPAESDRETVVRNGFPLLPRRGVIVTNQMVREIQDAIDQEELDRALALGRERPDRAP